MYKREIAIILAGIIAAFANLPAAYSCGIAPQHMNVFVISDDKGCIAGLIERGMSLPDPQGNKQYFPKDYDITCLDVPAKHGTNVFTYIENITVPSLRNAAKERSAGNIEQLYLFVYPLSLTKEFHNYIAIRFGAERASMVDGWTNIPAATAFSSIWASSIYHEGRHLAIHGTWHDDAGRPFPNNQVIYYPGFGPAHNVSDENHNGFVGAGLLRFLNIRPASLPSICSGSDIGYSPASPSIS